MSKFATRCSHTACTSTHPHLSRKSGVERRSRRSSGEKNSCGARRRKQPRPRSWTRGQQCSALGQRAQAVPVRATNGSNGANSQTVPTMLPAHRRACHAAMRSDLPGTMNTGVRAHQASSTAPAAVRSTPIIPIIACSIDKNSIVRGRAFAEGRAQLGAGASHVCLGVCHAGSSTASLRTLPAACS